MVPLQRYLDGEPCTERGSKRLVGDPSGSRGQGLPAAPVALIEVRSYARAGALLLRRCRQIARPARMSARVLPTMRC